MQPNCILFIPVSSPSGIGEYMRSMIIATALQQRWPTTNIHFILNTQVSYIDDCPFTVHTCNGSPTKHSKKVNEVMKNIKPDLVIFDASGRASQFKQAKAVGAKVAFISQHNKKRSRGLKLNRLFNTDIHWVVQPDFCIKPLNYWQRFKLKVFNKKVPENVGAVFELSEKNEQVALLAQLSLTKNNYFIFNAGSGGHKIDNELATDIYYQAAQKLQQQTAQKCIVLFGSNYPKPLPVNEHITCIESIDNKDFITLLLNARGCVLSAGDSLLQCIALQKPCVAAPVSPDQPSRLKTCEQEGLVFSAKATVNSLEAQATLMLDKAKYDAMTHHLKSSSAKNALAIITGDIASLFAAK
ncbi:hypothetical protein [Colwellia sp. E2M01]|uniref:glycosyltransferase family 9 protein n=1 Tax=Colwellia sp. E2M01 TaxID=2841561 RepID=UPI001C08900C|nr:hypothetical protein [Colwellia sp. E2M01]MBU2869687.1 hypothetical protein [Colwellia sp. E2M01]